MLTRLSQVLRRLRRSEKGVAALELALFAPFLALLLLGGYDLARFISYRANVDKVGFSVADVTSQYKELSGDAMKQVFTITATSMPSYVSGSTGVTILTSVYLDNNNVTRVKWQCYSTPGAEWKSKIGTEGQIAAVPSGLIIEKNEKDNLMVAEVFYKFTPLFDKFFHGTQILYTASMYRPRLGPADHEAILMLKRPRSVTARLRALLQSREGAVAPLIAILMLVLIGCVGLGIDVGRAAVVKARLVSALDAAGLAVGARTTTTDFNADARKYVDANFKANYVGATVTSVTATPNSDKTVITLTASATMPTALMKLFGTNTVVVTHTTEVTRASTGIELVMVLDNTGSMEQSGSMPGLKTAAKALVDQLAPTSSSTNNVYIGLVPFSQAVNIGVTNALWTDVATTLRSYYPTYWTGCVEERAAPMDQNDDPPSLLGFKAFYYPDDSFNNWIQYGFPTVSYSSYTSQRGPGAYCPTAVTPMSSSVSVVKAGIDAMRAQGSTMINVGAVWGWRMLSPRWKGVWSAEMLLKGLPLDYNAANMRKAIVLMTDGENSFGDPRDYDPYDRSNYTAYGFRSEKRLGTKKFDDANTELDKRLTTVCTAMKAKGIIVYTVAFNNPDPATKSLLQSCATSSAFAFDSGNTTELLSDFKKIGDSLSNLRVSK